MCLLDNTNFVPNVSVPLFIEYESVLKRTDLISHLSPDEIDDVLNFILSKSSVRKIHFLWRPYLKDPKDDLVLEVAVESNSKFIITHNVKDFNHIEKFGIQAIGPKEFLIERGVIK